MKVLFALFAFCVVSGCSFVSAQVPSCSRQQAMQSETEASTLSSWDAVYRSFSEFSACDDAAISEGYSESVSRLLADDWGNVGKLIILAERNPKFRAFVIKHIDETVPAARLKEIIANASNKCPAGAEKLCVEIVKAAK